jgi:hypothetical protein
MPRKFEKQHNAAICNKQNVTTITYYLRLTLSIIQYYLLLMIGRFRTCDHANEFFKTQSFKKINNLFITNFGCHVIFR